MRVKGKSWAGPHIIVTISATYWCKKIFTLIFGNPPTTVFDSTDFFKYTSVDDFFSFII